jgi:phospholipid/cholesterol/gamma-HCH transport system substrate-binding protein
MLRGGDAFDKPCSSTVATRCTFAVVDLGELFNRLGPIVSALDSKQVNDFLDTVSQALDGNTDKVGKAIDDLAVLAKALGERDQTIGRLVENLNTVAGTITNRDQQIRVMLDNLVLVSQTFSANTQTLDTALTEFGRFSTNLSAVLSGNRGELDRIISNLELVTSEVVGPKLGTIDSALRQLDMTAKSIFESSDLGEWLNQSILCAGVGPPGPGGSVLGGPAGSNCTGLSNVGSSGGGVLGSASTPAASAPQQPPHPASIGTQAGSQDAGIAALVNLLTGVLK